MTFFKIYTMKKLLVIISISLLSSSALFAQERMSFKGISLDNTVEDFVKKLKEKGFVKEFNDGGYVVGGGGENYVVLVGTFLNQTCEVAVIGVANTNTVMSVGVALPEFDTWSSLRSKYYNIKELYQSKYGKGESKEFFEGNYDDGDGYEMMALMEDKCKYTTSFITEQGGILISIIRADGFKKGLVTIGYIDGQSASLNASVNYDDI